jgi:hypothetical protein
VGIASQIFKHIIGSFDRVADTDHPFFGKQRVFEFLIGVGGKFEILVFNGTAHTLDELAAKDQ